jgi:hypothetical protein
MGRGARVLVDGKKQAPSCHPHPNDRRCAAKPKTSSPYHARAAGQAKTSREANSIQALSCPQRKLKVTTAFSPFVRCSNQMRFQLGTLRYTYRHSEIFG